jgi:hypothetical protein
MLAAGLLLVVGLGAADGEETSGFRSNLSGTGGVKFEVEHMEHGRKTAGKVVDPYFEIDYRGFDRADIYAGVNAVVNIEPSKQNQLFVANLINPHIGVTYDLNDAFTIDVGYAHRIYTGMPKELKNLPDGPDYDPDYDANVGSLIAKRNTNEISIGIMADVIMSPSLYVSYEIERREIDVEGAVKHHFDLSEHIVNGLGLEVGAKIGVDSAERPYGIKLTPVQREAIGKKNYFYYGLNADLVYGFTERANAKVGVGFNGNSAKKISWANAYGNHQNHVWFSASVDCAF